MGKIIGIDLGTTNSAMSVMEGAEPKVIPNAEGNRTTPSIVAESKNGERLAGQVAKRQAVINYENTIFSAKRLIGRSFNDEEVKKDIELMPYKIVKSGAGVKVKMGEKEYSPAEISAMILGKLKTDAEAYLGEPVTEAVITVPAYFNDAQRQATKDAGKIAGLDVKRIINEPTAAAFAYGLNSKKEEKVAVYDLGGGTFDVSILDIGDGIIEVLSTNGDTHLGGDDFDQEIMNFLVDEFKKEQGIDLKSDTAALQRLKEAAENAKIELSSKTETDINIPFVTADASGPKHLNIKMTRAKLEGIVETLIKKTLKPCEVALKDAGIKKTDINEIILVGGMTRMPAVQAAVKEFFGKEPLKGVNPDEVVAIGAGLQGGQLSGDLKNTDILLLDVTPLSLGIETLGGVSTKLIEKNTTIPTSASQVFSTAADNQTSVEVVVLQGEREFAADNKSLGRFTLDGIPPAPRGIPQVEVKFDIDANGIVHVTATDKATNKEQKITITASSALTDDEIDKMQKDAEAHAEEDKTRKEFVDLKNMADALVYTAEKTLKEAGDKAKDEDKKDVEAKVEELKKVKDGDDKDVIQKAYDELSEAIQKVGASMYAQPEEGAGTDENTSEDAKTDEPVEGEVVEEEKKEDDKK